MKLIGLGCTAQVGKDTAADFLQRKYPKRVKRVAFADELKNAAISIFSLTQEQCYGPQAVKEAVDPRYGKSPRQLLQELGEKMREIFPEIWVVRVFNETIPALEKQGYDIFVVSDVRYPNEADYIHKLGGWVVRVNRAEGGVTVGAEHSSETSMADYTCDYEINNDGTIVQYFEKVEQMMADLYSM